jgi:hypothetical protein
VRATLHLGEITDRHGVVEDFREVARIARTAAAFARELDASVSFACLGRYASPAGLIPGESRNSFRAGRTNVVRDSNFRRRARQANVSSEADDHRYRPPRDPQRDQDAAVMRN